MISKIKFIIAESFRGFFYAWTPALLSCITIGISLFVITISFFSYFLFINYTNTVTKDYELNVFFNESISLENAEKSFNEILLLPSIKNGEFINKKKSAEKFKTYFSSNIEDLLGENPLPYSAQFNISQNNRNLDSLLMISKNLKKINSVDIVKYDKEILIRFENIINKLMTTFSIIGIAIVIISIILVSNTTRLMIHSKKESINILSLLGATNLFIRVPFLIEGIMQGLLGASMSIASLYFLKILLEYIFVPLVIVNDYNFQLIILLNLGLGIIFGLIGSKRAVSKYLS
ncbi:MAG: hypothetical protein CBD21_04355 [bacterium TMED161]|nr:MAG: hypothetical protein CBD21_04355 [bacterium TMED161]